MNLSLMPGFCKHFCLDFVLFLLPMAGRAGTATSTSKSSSSCQTCWAVCHSEATHNLSDTWTTNLGTTRLKSLSCGCWGSAALALCEQSSICTGIFWALPFFFFFAAFLSCSLKVPGGNQNLLALFKGYCGSPERAQKTPEKWQHHIITSKISRVSHQCYQFGCTGKLLKSTASKSVFSWVSPQKNAHVVIYDFGLLSNSFPRLGGPLENTFM